MMRSLLIRGMLVGILAGILAFAFAQIFGEPQVDRAVAFEAQAEHDHDAPAPTPAAHSHSHGPAAAPTAAPGNAEPELVSRATQKGIGLLTGIVVYSTAFGGLFAIVFGLVYGRVGRLGARATSAILAATGFIAVYAVPNLKYPANPPAVGITETIGVRTALFFIMVAISIAAMIFAVWVRQSTLRRFGAWNATLVGGAAFLVVIALANIILPSLNEVSDQFPAAVLWNFRIAALGIQLVMWSTLALVFGVLAEDLLKPRSGMRLAGAA